MVAYAGVFATEEKARAVSERLIAEGFPEANVCVVTSQKEVDDALASKRGPNFFSGVTTRLNEAIQAGKSVVSAIAPLGRGELAISIHEEMGAEKVMEADVKKTTRMSDAFGWPSTVKYEDIQSSHVFSNLTTDPDSHITPNLTTKPDTHMTPGLISKRHITGGLGLDKHITGGLLTKDRTHITSFMPLITSSRRKK